MTKGGWGFRDKRSTYRDDKEGIKKRSQVFLKTFYISMVYENLFSLERKFIFPF
jgi:hypothetical protein